MVTFSALVVWNLIQGKLKPSTRQDLVRAIVKWSLCLVWHSMYLDSYQIMPPSQPHYACWRNRTHLGMGARRTKSIEWAERSPCWRSSYVLFWPQSLSMPVHLVLVVFWYKRVKFLFMQVVPWVMLKAATPKWRETLAVVWEVEHFLPHVYGAQFSVITGHKSVIGIFKNHKQTSLQIERWKLWLMPYDCQLIY